MRNKFNSIPESKLSKTLSQISSNNTIEKTGFVTKSNKSALFKTKSFRFRESDLLSLLSAQQEINKRNDRMNYSESQIIRGLINYFAENLESDIGKIMPYIKSSS